MGMTGGGLKEVHGRGLGRVIRWEGELGTKFKEGTNREVGRLVMSCHGFLISLVLAPSYHGVRRSFTKCRIVHSLAGGTRPTTIIHPLHHLYITLSLYFSPSKMVPLAPVSVTTHTRILSPTATSMLSIGWAINVLSSYYHHIIRQQPLLRHPSMP